MQLQSAATFKGQKMQQTSLRNQTAIFKCARLSAPHAGSDTDLDRGFWKSMKQNRNDDGDIFQPNRFIPE